MLLAPRRSYQDDAAEIVCRWPFVVIRVFRFGITFGALVGFALLTHILYTMQLYRNECLFLRIICAARALLWLPTPYVCWQKYQQLDMAERETSTERVGMAVCFIIRVNRKRDRIMLVLLYAWICVAMFATLASSEGFAQSVWNHACYATFCMLVHRLLCTLLFILWSQGNAREVMSVEMLEKHSSIMTVVEPRNCKDRSEIPCKSEDLCPICYDEVNSGHSVRKLWCGHTFHRECVDPWLRFHYRRCPLCQSGPQ